MVTLEMEDALKIEDVFTQEGCRFAHEGLSVPLWVMPLGCSSTTGVP